MENDRLTLEELVSEIEKLRQLIFHAATDYGFESKEVLAYSQELDKLIIQFQLQNS